jgi:hypothetical protein
MPKNVNTAMAASAKCSPYEITWSEDRATSNMLSTKAIILQSRLIMRSLAIAISTGVNGFIALPAALPVNAIRIFIATKRAIIMVIFIIIFGWAVVSAGYCSHQTAGKRHANHSWRAAGEAGKCTNDSPHPNLISTGVLGAAAEPIAIAAVVSIPTAANQFHLI